MSQDDLTVQVGLTEKQYMSALSRMEQSALRSAKRAEGSWEKSNRSFVRGAKRAEASANAFSRNGLRQMSMQFSQVAQQGAVTGNYLQALAVQLPDLALGFGTLAIAAGAVAPILLSVAQNALQVGDEAEDAGDKVSAFVQAASRLESIAKIATAPLGELRDEFGEFADEVQKAAQIVAQSQLSTAMQGLDGVADSLKGDLGEVIGLMAETHKLSEALARIELQQSQGIANSEQVFSAREAFEITRELADEAAAAIGLTTRQVLDMQMALDDLDRAEGMSDVAAAASNALDVIDEMFSASQNIPPEIAKITAHLDEVLKAAAAGSAAFDDISEAAGLTQEEMALAAEAAARLDAVIGSVDFSAAISGAIALSQSLDVSLHKAMEIMGLVGAAAQSARDKGSATILDPRDPRYDPIAAEMQKIRDEGYGTVSVFHPSRQPRVSSSGRGGGGGSKISDKARKDAAALREVERYVNQTRTAIERYEEELRKLSELEPFFEQAGQAEAYARAVAKVNEEFQRAQSDQLLDGIESISDAMAQAIVDGENMGDALNDIFRQIAADLMSSGIRSLLMEMFSGTGGGGGGVIGSIVSAMLGGKRAVGGPVSAGKAYLVGEKGPEIMVPNTAGSIVPNNQIGSGGDAGGYHYTFAPVIDARGTDSSVVARLHEAVKSLDASIEPRVGRAIVDGKRQNLAPFRNL